MSIKGMALVGLDVHAAQTHAAVLDTGTGELSVTKLWGAPEEALSFFEGLGPRVRGVYEAWPDRVRIGESGARARDRLDGRRAGLDPEGVG
jgi:hypothetical protein